MLTICSGYIAICGWDRLAQMVERLLHNFRLYTLQEGPAFDSAPGFLSDREFSQFITDPESSKNANRTA